MRIAFHVPVKPQPGGSKRGFPLKLGGGKMRMVITDANAKAKPWQAAVRAEAMLAYRGELLRGPVRLTLTFCLTRPKGHFGMRGLKPSAPAHHIVKPDALKLARAVEDSLAGILFHDDSQIVEEHLSKVYAEQNGCDIEVETL